MTNQVPSLRTPRNTVHTLPMSTSHLQVFAVLLRGRVANHMCVQFNNGKRCAWCSSSELLLCFLFLPSPWFHSGDRCAQHFVTTSQDHYGWNCLAWPVRNSLSCLVHTHLQLGPILLPPQVVSGFHTGGKGGGYVYWDCPFPSSPLPPEIWKLCHNCLNSYNEIHNTTIKVQHIYRPNVL